MNEAKIRRKFRRDVKRIERRIVSYGGKTVEKEWHLQQNLEPWLFKLFLKKGARFLETERPDGVVGIITKSKDRVKYMDRLVRNNADDHRYCEGFALAPYGRGKNSRWFRHRWAYHCVLDSIIEPTSRIDGLRCEYWGVIIGPGDLR